MSGRSIAFLTIGSFSHTNEAILRILREAYPEHRIDHVDVGRMIRRDPIVLATGLIALMLAYGPAVLVQKGARWRAFFGTPRIFHAIRRKLRRRLAGRDYAFTFQTQSLFDGSQPGIPHFVYTDHTARMNREYGSHYAGIESRISPDWLALEATLYRHATRVFTQTERAARSVVEDYAVEPDLVRCVYAGGNVVGEPTNVPDRYLAKHILYVGTSWDRKGGADVVEAFSRVLDEHPDARLTLIGPAPAQTLRNVTALGRVPLDELGHHLDRASVFCVPTRREPLGFVFIEAAQHGLPIVATRVGSLPELVIDGVTGRLVEVGDIPALAGALSEMLDDPDRRAEFGRRGREHLVALYTWESVATRLVQGIRTGLAAGAPLQPD